MLLRRHLQRRLERILQRVGIKIYLYSLIFTNSNAKSVQRNRNEKKTPGYITDVSRFQKFFCFKLTRQKNNRFDVRCLRA